MFAAFSGVFSQLFIPGSHLFISVNPYVLESVTHSCAEARRHSYITGAPLRKGCLRSGSRASRHPCASLQMFSWSVGFCMEAQMPGQRSPEELVTNTLMLELGALLKPAVRLHQERGTDAGRRRSSVNYSWLAAPHQKPPYEPSPGELLELHSLCTKIRPSQCGPVILRWGTAGDPCTSTGPVKSRWVH